MRQLVTALTVISLCAIGLVSRRAEACGCFAPPDPTVPIVQAGERILFSVENGVVTAHVQIQYAGDAADFGWLLPLPSVPTLSLGSEEVFTQLTTATQPEYRVTQVFNGACGGRGGVGLANAAPGAESGVDFSQGGPSPLVTQSSIGPYDYAVLRADSKTEMLNWLTNNRYFIPVGTDESVTPYINPGAYFLALKLKSGKSAGDIQPVVLTYPSQLPMIPIVLTSVAAQPNMGVLVWMLGEARAIPRNYNHVIINDAQIDWLNRAQNYNDVIIRAVSETPEKHAFVTEYAGTSGVMATRLWTQSRFGSQTELASRTNPSDFVSYLYENGFTSPTRNSFGSDPLIAGVRSIVMAGLPAQPAGTNEENFLQNLRFGGNAGVSSIDSAALAAQIFELVVEPLREAQTLVDSHPKLTRLYTTLSPEDMTRDPVFSFNPELPDVSNIHTATQTVNCGFLNTAGNSPSTLVTEQGWTFSIPGGATRDLTVGPAALRIETLREEGGPELLTDNTPRIEQTQNCGGCSSVDPASLTLLALGTLLLRRRRA